MVRAYRAYHLGMLEKFERTMGIKREQMDWDALELLGKETPSDEWIAAWTAAKEWYKS